MSSRPHRRCAALPLGLALLATLAAASAVEQLATTPRVINNLLVERLDAFPGVHIAALGDRPYTTVERPAPRLLDDALLHDDEWKPIFGAGSDFVKPFPPHYTAPYVASIPHATVFSTMGEVIDKNGNVYASLFATPSVEVSMDVLAQRAADAAAKKVHRYTKLATTVHVFGHMYFHFVTESLPRILMLKPILADPEVKVLTWNLGPWDKAWMKMLLDIDESRIVEYNPEEAYTADVVYMPSPLVRTGFQFAEDLDRLRNAVGADMEVPPPERNVLLYITRKNAEDRRIRNEEELVVSLRHNFPELEVVVYDSADYGIAETIALFKRAKVVLSGHGAGMSHTVFCAKNTPIIEIHHADIADEPHIDFYMTSTALKQPYYMVPITGVTWLALEYDTFIPLTVSTVQRALYDVYSMGRPVCAAGSAPQADGNCGPCSVGTYSTGLAAYSDKAGAIESAVCLPCDAGWVSLPGKGGCHPCPHGQYPSADRSSCVACPAGQSTPFLGSTGVEACLPSDVARAELKRANDLKSGIFKTSAIVRRYMREAKIPHLTVNLPAEIVNKVVDHWEHVSNRRLALADGCNSYGNCPPSPLPSPPPVGPTSILVRNFFPQGASFESLKDATGRNVVWNDDEDFLDLRTQFPVSPLAVLGASRCRGGCGPCPRAWRPTTQTAGALRSFNVFFREPIQISSVEIHEVNAPNITEVALLPFPAIFMRGSGGINRDNPTVILSQARDTTTCGEWLTIDVPASTSGINRALPRANTANANRVIRAAAGGIRVTVRTTGNRDRTPFLASIRVDGRVLYPDDVTFYSRFAA